MSQVLGREFQKLVALNLTDLLNVSDLKASTLSSGNVLEVLLFDDRVKKPNIDSRGFSANKIWKVFFKSDHCTLSLTLKMLSFCNKELWLDRDSKYKLKEALWEYLLTFLNRLGKKEEKISLSILD
jgi:hypothetical protein